MPIRVIFCKEAGGRPPCTAASISSVLVSTLLCNRLQLQGREMTSSSAALTAASYVLDLKHLLCRQLTAVRLKKKDKNNQRQTETKVRLH